MIKNKDRRITNPNRKGIVLSSLTKQKMKESAKKRKERDGYINSPETIEKIRLKNIGSKRSEKSKEKMRIKALNRKIHPCLGKHWKIKDTSKMIGRTKEKCYNWQDGKSFEVYGEDWTYDLKESIRKKDNYICQECGVHQDELDIGQVKKLDIHHKDYDKRNLNPNNLITLCRVCHMKTNYNRKYWLNYFNNFI